MNLVEFCRVAVLALATAAIAVTVSKAKIFNGVRERVIRRSHRLGELLTCPYCTSHWVAFTLVAIYRPVLVQAWLPVDLLVSAFVVVALASLVMGLVLFAMPMRGTVPALSADNEEPSSSLRHSTRNVA
ncbi:MAG: DUF1360 domain-containing protein [Candidatus Kerfeldbacteria bacterium]|nr:DUF1360 domain-containing protein [Candidatus Kerfeldbacteria bacterium]